MEVASTALVSPRPAPAPPRAPKRTPSVQSPEPAPAASDSSTGAPPPVGAPATPEAIEGIRAVSRRLGNILRQTRIEFDTVSSAGDVTITVFDRETNEVIRRIPMESILQTQAFSAAPQGLLLNAKA